MVPKKYRWPSANTSELIQITVENKFSFHVSQLIDFLDRPLLCKTIQLMQSTSTSTKLKKKKLKIPHLQGNAYLNETCRKSQPHNTLDISQKQENYFNKKKTKMSFELMVNGK